MQFYYNRFISSLVVNNYKNINKETKLLNFKLYGMCAYSGSNMAASATAIRDRGISVTTRGVRCHGNTPVADDN